MRILLDHCVDRRLRRELPDHEVMTTYEMGWAALKNGELLDNAQRDFEVFVTTDQNIKYQQNLSGRSIAVVVLVAPNNRLKTLTPLMPQVAALLPRVRPGELIEVERT